MNRDLGHFWDFWANKKLSQKNLLGMVRWVRRHCPPDTGFEIQTLVVWGRARHFSVKEASRNTEFYVWMGGKHFFQTAETGKRTPAWSVKGRGANHHPRAPTHHNKVGLHSQTCQISSATDRRRSWRCDGFILEAMTGSWANMASSRCAFSPKEWPRWEKRAVFSYQLR